VTETSSAGASPATEPKRPEATLGELVNEMTSELSTLVRQELELAKAETRVEIARTAKAGGMFAGAGLAAWMAIVMLSLAIAWLLDQGINRALAFALVGVVWAVGGLLLYLAARKRVERIEGLPETRESIKEDVQWAKAQKS